MAHTVCSEEVILTYDAMRSVAELVRMTDGCQVDVHLVLLEVVEQSHLKAHRINQILLEAEI